MLQRLPIIIAQVKADNISEDLLNEIRQIIYSVCRAKEITKKVYNNIMNSIKLQNRMDPIPMNCEKVINILFYQILAFSIHGKT